MCKDAVHEQGANNKTLPKLITKHTRIRTLQLAVGNTLVQPYVLKRDVKLQLTNCATLYGKKLWYVRKSAKISSFIGN